MPKRAEFLKKCLDMGLSAGEILEFTQHMKDKTPEEKEELAAQFIEALNERGTPSTRP